MPIAIVPVIVLLVGLLAFALASNPKVAELGRIGFFVGLLVTVVVFAGHVLRL